MTYVPGFRCSMVRRNRLERLEDRRLLAGDVCFPLSPAQSTSGLESGAASSAFTSTVIDGPVQLASSSAAESESGVSGASSAATFVSILPATGIEGDSLSPAEIATASSIASNKLDFTVMLDQPATTPTTVEVLTSDGSALALRVERIASGLSSPLYATAPTADFDRLFVIEQRSGIRIIDLNSGTLNPTPFLTIPDLNQNNNEGGLLGLAFHPDYATNGRFFVNMTNNRQPFGDNIGDTFIREYQVSPGNPDLAIATPVQTILTVQQPAGNHNGGWLDFGPDGFLYIAFGDGGGGNDTYGNGQNLNTILGSIARIDINGDDFPADQNRNYAIPPSNPFVGTTGLDEIWAYGLRNPYRNSFDRVTGDLFIADVGQAAWEEINVQRSTSVGGENYGWPLREGMIQTPAGVGGAKPPGAIDPVYDYPRGFGDLQGNSVTGGYVYRGPIEDLNGQYFFGDFLRSHIWSFRFNGDAPASHNDTNYDGFTDWVGLLAPDVGSIGNVASFGEDAAGNLFIVDFGGEVFAIRNGADYVPTRQTIQFAIGEQTKTFSVPIVYDILQESDETFQVSIGAVTGALIGNGTAIGTITNDDGVPTDPSVVINDGAAQRSMITSLTLTFNGVVDLSSASFALTNLGTTANPTSVDVNSLIVDRQVIGLQTIVAITFGSGPSVVDRAAGNSLADGNYELRINGTAIFGEQPEDNFFRLFGDGNGDGVTNIFDFSESFLPSFGLSSASDGYKSFMDFDGNDVVNIFDFSNGYLPNFGSSR